MRFFPYCISAFLLLTVLCSCKKDDQVIKDPRTTADDTSTVDVSPEKKLAIFESINTLLASIPWDNRAVAHTQIQAYLKTIPEFRQVHYSPEGDNVWAQFTDGTLYMILNNRPHDKDFTDIDFSSSRQSKSNQRVAEMKSTFMPQSNKVFLFNSLGNSFPSTRYSTNNIKNIFYQKGYEVSLFDGTIENLKTVKDVGVFYFSSHGGFFKFSDKDQVYGAWTSDVFTKENEALYKKELKDRTFVYISAAHNIGADGKEEYETHLGFTSKFVEKYMSFSNFSLLYLDICESFREEKFQTELLKKTGNTGTFLGWTDLVDDKDSYASAAFFFDRMLATNSPYNSYKPENPSQRAFDLTSIMGDLERKGFGKSLPYSNQPTRFAYLKYKSFPNMDIILRPSIAYMHVDELNEMLYLYGYFGEEIGETIREITIDGVPAEISAWSASLVQCKIKSSGKGSAGDVIVNVRGSKSHPRTLTDWRGTIKYKRPSEGSLMEEITFNIHLRGDVGKYREVPGETPVLVPQSTFLKFPATDSKATFSMGGSAAHSFTVGCSYQNSVTWTDNKGTLPLFNPSTGGNPLENKFMMTVALSETGFKVENLSPIIVTNSTAHYKSFFQCAGGSGENPVGPQLVPFETLSDKFKNFALVFDANFNIKPGKITEVKESRAGIPHGGEIISDPIPTFEASLEWSFSEVNFPPKSNTPK